MRIERLEIGAYGHLENFPLDLSDRSRLVHVVYGPNEAGKTTIKSAIEDLLFGFEKSTPYAFRFPYDALRLAATLSNANNEMLTFTRLKKRASLFDPAGNPLADDALEPFLRGVTHEEFVRDFSLNQASLRTGSRQMAEGGGDLGATLYSAALGNRNPTAIIKRLDAQMGEIWSPQAKKKTLNVALTRFDERRKALDALVQRPQAWLDQQAEFATVTALLDRISRRSHENATAIGLLQRLIARASTYQRLISTRANLAAETGIILDQATVDVLRMALTDEQRVRKDLADTVAKLAHLAAQAEPEDDIVTEDAALRALYSESGAVAKGLQDMERLKMREYAETNREEAQSILARLWPGLEIEAAHARSRAIPTDLTARGTRLVLEQTTILRDRDAADGARERARVNLADLRASEALLPPPVSADALRAVVDSATAEGPLDTRISDAKLALAQRSTEAETRLRRMGLFTGTLEELAAAALPGVETLNAMRAESDALAAEVSRIAGRRADAGKIRDDQNQQIAAHKAGGTLRTVDDLLGARAERDGLFAELQTAWRAGEPVETLDQAAETYTPAVSSADALADDLRLNADLVATIAQLISARDRAASDEATHTAALDEQTALQAAFTTRWNALWAQLGIAPRTPAEMREWLQEALAIRALADRIAADSIELAALSDKRSYLIAAIRTALLAAGGATIDDVRMDPHLLAGRAHLKYLDEQATRRESLGAEIARETRNLDRHEVDITRAAEALATIEPRWFEVLDGLFLPRTLEITTFGETAALIPAFRTVNDKARANRDRMNGVLREKDAFGDRVMEFTRRVAPDLVRTSADAPFEVVEVLYERLTQARAAMTRNAARREESATLSVTKATLEARLDELDKQIHERLAATGVAREAIDDAIARSVRVHEWRANEATYIAELTSDIGIPIDACIDAYADRSINVLEADLAEATDAAERLKVERDEAHGRRRDLERLLAGLHDSLDAVAAQAEMVAAASDIDRQTQRWSELAIAKMLLEQQISAFEEQMQGPLLRRAEDFFKRLTGGNYTKLRALTHDGARYLEAVNRNDFGSKIDALSEGTRDQLFFSLRIAALESHLGSNEPQPLILDDAFPAFDDDRSVRAFEILAIVGASTQVIYFTHHAAIVEAARKGIPDTVLAIHTLPDRWAEQPAAVAGGA